MSSGYPHKAFSILSCVHSSEEWHIKCSLQTASTYYWCFTENGPVCSPDKCKDEHGSCIGLGHDVASFDDIIDSAHALDKCRKRIGEQAAQDLKDRLAEVDNLNEQLHARVKEITLDIRAAEKRILDAVTACREDLERDMKGCEFDSRLRKEAIKMLKCSDLETLQAGVADFVVVSGARVAEAKALAAGIDGRPIRLESMDRPFFSLMDQLRALNDNPEASPPTAPARTYESYRRKRTQSDDFVCPEPKK